MGVFTQDSTDRQKHLIEVLAIIDNNGPKPADIAQAYEEEFNNRFADLSLSRLSAMDFIIQTEGDDPTKNTIKLTARGQAVLNGEIKPLLEGLCDGFIGFYDTIAILAASPVRISTIRSYLNQANDLSWNSNREPKRRVDWLRDWNLAELQTGANEYTLTKAGEEAFDLLKPARGTPNIASLFIHGSELNAAEEALTTEDSGDTSVDTTTGDKTSTTESKSPSTRPVKATKTEDSPDLPFIHRTEQKIISIHINKVDGTIERYRRTVEDNSELASLSDDKFPCEAVRYWAVDEEELDHVDGLVRGDALLFHHYDEGYMAIGQVLSIKQVDVTHIATNHLVLLESVHTVEMNRQEIFDICDWEAHPKGQWVRLDTEEEINERYGSAAAFIQNIQGQVEFDYWRADNWAIDDDLARKLDRQLRRKGQVIIYGPPGTGKTFNAETFAKWWTGKQENTVPTEYQTESITFHPSYSYEDFVEGYTITNEGSAEGTNQESHTNPSNQANDSPYGLKRGIFRKFCEKAVDVQEATDDDQPTPRYVLVIDELNRGNVAQIFGENITILEKDKRGSYRNLSHSGEPFTIPDNVYVIATMNTADQSITRLDAAIRRRFAALQMIPSYDIFYDLNNETYPESRDAAAELIQTDRADTETLLAASLLALEVINKQIVQIPSLGKGKRIGHSYLLPSVWQEKETDVPDDTALTDVWRYDILPLLEEYFFQDSEALEQQIFDGEAQFVDHETHDIVELNPENLREKLKSFVLDNHETIGLTLETE